MTQASASNRPRLEGSYYEATVPATLDLAERAQLGINHFMSIISEEHNYEMYWGPAHMPYGKVVLSYAGYPGDALGYNFGHCNPPVSNLWWSSLQACQPKAMEALVMLRLMSGSALHLEREASMLEMMISNVEDGLYWVPKDPSKPWLGKDEDRPYANMHGQGRILRAMMAWYQYTGNPVWKERTDQMIDGLDRIAIHKDDYAYFPTVGWIPHEYFRSCYLKNRGWKDTVEPQNEKSGEEGSLFNHQGHLPGAMATWYLMTGNEKAIRLSGELVRFLTKQKFWADWEGGEYPGVVGADHAHWCGHFHGYVNTLRAILDYALAVNDARLKAFVRDGYEWSRQSGLARIGLVGDGQGCGTGRLIGLAVKLTYAGIGEYWEDVDLYIRNHGVEMQLTPEDIPWLEERCEGKSPAPDHPSQTSEGVIEANMGAFASSVPPCKSSTGLCCSSHGNMGLFYAWDGIIRCQDGIAQVNLLLNRASPWMDIDSYLPYEGKVVLTNKTAREVFVRIPLWVDRKAVRCTRSGEELSIAWFGSYLRVGSLQSNDVLTLEFPMAERTEKWTIPRIHAGWPVPEEQVHELRFRGNTLVEITPPLMLESPLYQSRPEKYKATKAPLKKVTRYVSPLTLLW